MGSILNLRKECVLKLGLQRGPIESFDSSHAEPEMARGNKDYETCNARETLGW